MTGPTPRTRPPTGRARHRATAASAALALCLAPVLAGCSDDEEPAATPPPSSPTTATEPPALPTTASIGEVTGRLSRPDRKELLSSVTGAVDAWIDGAYGGDYPRRDFAGAYRSFTGGAQQRAAADRRVTSNAGVGDRVDDVRITARRVVVDVLAPGGTAAGATARVRLGLQLSGRAERRDRVLGELYLTPVRDRWKVFGYDLKRGRV